MSGASPGGAPSVDLQSVELDEAVDGGRCLAVVVANPAGDGIDDVVRRLEEHAMEPKGHDVLAAAPGEHRPAVVRELHRYGLAKDRLDSKGENGLGRGRLSRLGGRSGRWKGQQGLVAASTPRRGSGTAGPKGWSCGDGFFEGEAQLGLSGGAHRVR